MRYTDLNSSLESHISTLRAVIGVLVLINISLWIGWNGAKDHLRIHIPPDIRSGAVIREGEIAPANVYIFASYIYQQLNNWAKNGEKDYGMQIYKMESFLTPDFREYLINDMEIRGKRGELTGRIRGIQPIPGQEYEERRVDLIADGAWIIWLDFNIQETVRGMDVKNVNIRYPLRVVRYNVDPESNPWGLALDGFATKGPQKLTKEELAASSQDTPPSR